MTPRTLTGRVALLAALTVGIALAVAGTAILVASDRADRDSFDRDLRATLSRVKAPAAQALGLQAGTTAGGLPDAVIGLRPGDAAAPALDPGEGRFVRAVEANGASVVAGAAVPAGFGQPRRTGLRTVDAGGAHWRTAGAALPGGATVETAAPLTPLENRERRLRQIVLGTLLAALAATGLAARWLAGLALRPLAALRASAAAVRETGDAGARVRVAEGPEEVAALGGELDGMLARLEEEADARDGALRSARRFAADAGHELRTPLATLTTSIAMARDPRADPAHRDASLTTAADEAERMRGLVDGLQALARGEAGMGPHTTVVDIAELADAAVAAVRVRHPERTFTLTAPGSGPSVAGDADGLRRLLDNLLENAATHGGHEIQVTVDGGGIVVDDDGPGIPAAERARLLQRFQRGATADRTGSGLGLAIVAAEATRHDGGVTLEDSPAGGLRARVSLPTLP